MLAFCNFGKYQEYVFPHQLQKIVSTGARAASPRLCTWRTGVHGLPLVRAQASRLRRCTWPWAQTQPQLSSRCWRSPAEPQAGDPCSPPARRKYGYTELWGCSPTNSHGPSRSCIMQFTLVRSGHVIYACPRIRRTSSYGLPC